MAVGSPYTHYKLNDSDTNTTVADDGSGAKDGVASGNTDTLSVAGRIDDCFDFVAASTEEVTLTALAEAIRADATGSLSLWFNFDIAAGTIFAINDASATQTWFRVSIDTGAGNRIAVSLSDQGGYEWLAYTPGAGIVASTWYHLVIVQGGSIPVIYINTVPVDITWANQTDRSKWLTDVNGADLLDTGHIACQEQSGAETDYYDGKIDQVKYYQNEALSAADVVVLYKEGLNDNAVFFGANF